MSNPASGLFKQVAYKVEATYGTIAAQSGAQALRRITSTIDLAKDTYQSKEIKTSMQVSDFRHGVRRVKGKITGDLSAGTYADFIAWALKRDFSAITAIASVSLTVAGTGPTYTVTRGTGSYLTDGVKVGHVVRLSVGTLNAANLSKNLLVTGVTGAALTVLPINGEALVAEGPVAGCTVTVTGKTTFVPQSGHTDKSFDVEHWYSDLAQSEVFLGCKVESVDLSLPPMGLAQIELGVVGQDFADTAAKRGAVALTSQYFTSPGAVTTSGALAAVNGVLRMNGVAVAVLTGLSLKIAPGLSGEAVVGSKVVPFQFPGTVVVTGQATAYFDSVTLRDAFVAETEIDLVGVFTEDNTAASHFMSVVLPRLKLGSADKGDGEGGLVQTINFTALEALTGGTGISTEKTTVMIQDSRA